MFGLEPFKAFASATKTVVVIAMKTQIPANAFVQFQVVDPRDLLIVFCILTNDSKKEIVCKKAMYLRRDVAKLMTMATKP